MSDYFPPEIIYEFIIRLPVKSLIRFTLVSKSWCSLITSKKFISEHLNHTLAVTTTTATTTPSTITTKNSLLLLRRYTNEDKQEHYTIHIDSDQKTDPAQFPYSISPQPPLEVDLPIKSQVGYYRIVGSVDGLICLFDDYFRDIPGIVLWNPSIRKHITLPFPNIRPSQPHMVVLGFGRDLSRNDYKIVRLVYWKDENFGYEMFPDVEVYSLEKRAWRGLPNPAIQCNVVQFTWSNAYLNGRSYWIARKSDPHTNLVLSFDMGSEVFKEISLPEVLTGGFSSELVIDVYKESLAVLLHHEETFSSFCKIWVMNDDGVPGSWTYLYNLKMVAGVKKTVGFRKNGELLMVKINEELVLYDPENRLVMNLDIYGSARAYYADKYVESLVLLEGRDGIVVDDLIQLVAQSCRIEEANGDAEGSSHG